MSDIIVDAHVTIQVKGNYVNLTMDECRELYVWLKKIVDPATSPVSKREEGDGYTIKPFASVEDPLALHTCICEKCGTVFPSSMFHDCPKAGVST